MRDRIQQSRFETFSLPDRFQFAGNCTTEQSKLIRSESAECCFAVGKLRSLSLTWPHRRSPES